MIKSSLYLRILNIFSNNNILTILNYILFIYFFSFILYSYEINAIDETNNANYFFQNTLLEKFTHNNNSRIGNYLHFNITNLTNNNEDSIYGQIEVFGNNVYVVWQESVSKNLPAHNYDIFFIKSEDNGKTFGMPINLSNNTEFSERPQIAVSKNGIFIVWAETTNPNNKEIMFTKSLDNGKTFNNPINLSHDSKDSDNQEISAFNENVYVIWQDTDKKNNDTNGIIMFKSSTNTGHTFNNSIELINNTNSAFPKINSYGNHVYVVYNNENKKNSGLFFLKSFDKGNNFYDIIKLSNDSNFGESQIAVNENELHVIWGGSLTKNIENIYYVKSNDNGKTFTDANTISDKVISNNTIYYSELNDIIENPTNVEVTNKNFSYIVWQNSFSEQNEDILLRVENHKDNSHFNIFNLSNNSGISECPSIAISDNNIYVIWEDYTSGNHEIFLANISI
ncbi:MAG TPA: sialidase family protein [Nitrososphaeraceae archaeon]|nr:sialidase family protein [Nitrososphaeraceae archaeon]